MGNHFLNFGQFSVPCRTLIQFGSPAFHVDQYSALLILMKLSRVHWAGGRLSFFLWGRSGGGLVFCWFI